MEFLLEDERMANLDQVVSELGVCSATIRNWVRHGIVKAESVNGRLVFSPQEIADLKSGISEGKIDRLKRRANKKASARMQVPSDYAADNDVLNVFGLVQKLSQGRDRYELLFALVLNVLRVRDLITLCADHFVPNTAKVAEELVWWRKKCPEFSVSENNLLIQIEIPINVDFLGIAYQGISTEGDKSKRGAHYTPEAIVCDMVDLNVSPDSFFLDPCCGTGQFLIAAAKKVCRPENIWGFDVDEVAVRIARVNLISLFSTKEFSPNLFTIDALSGVVDGLSECEVPRFDAIVTNPPWGAHFMSEQKTQIEKLYPAIRSNEAFSLFICRSWLLLKPGGTMSFILPNAFLNIKLHSDIREFVLRNCQIERIVALGRAFENVFSEVIRLDLKKEIAHSNHKFDAGYPSALTSVKQDRLLQNADFTFDIFVRDVEQDVFRAMLDRAHVTLLDNAEWALGIVTGDNSKYLSEATDIDYEPILTGRNIKKFIADAPGRFIKLDIKRFQQVAPLGKYRSEEKLIYKFITNELAFSYDDQKTLTLNSANIVIPNLPNYSMKSAMAFLNSRIFQFFFEKRICAIKVLRGDLEKLPFPRLSAGVDRTIVQFVDKLLDTTASNALKRRAFEDLDELVLGQFELNVDLRDYVRKHARLSSRLLPFD